MISETQLLLNLQEAIRSGKRSSVQEFVQECQSGVEESD